MNIAERQAIWVFESGSPKDTRDLGRTLGKEIARLAARQSPHRARRDNAGGEVILLEGGLGAGKTCLTGGLARGLGINEPAVSPTFVIQRSYQAPAKKDGGGGLRLHHFDFYRFEGGCDLETVGYEDCPGPDAVVLVEWPERCPEVFQDATLVLRITMTGDSARIEAHAGARPSQLAEFRP